ncbi:hypothetical protein GBAR_LOCUS26605 [Geodia barretti]|uniref:Uncharacterized protein n=1 Tax=Geodia barretti TaxID=519541 RepID=A0AA35TI93_GEOBA|nr:hypothetical protein GBAR_LOCUS26605 [Geodia barretti]
MGEGSGGTGLWMLPPPAVTVIAGKKWWKEGRLVCHFQFTRIRTACTCAIA